MLIYGMEILKGYFRSSIQLAQKKGTENQQINIEGVIAQTAQSAGELKDLLSGKKDRKKNKHHPIPALAMSVICGVKSIAKVRSEIKKNIT